ncbi:MAG: glycosyltransferase family 9 protein [Mariprofundaceae bacterium]|nr:glycosyltransferase family 9 protein [Mariprofundaceae bacterium]
MAIRHHLRNPWLALRSMLLRLLPGAPHAEMVHGEVRRILVIRLDRLGDVVLTSAIMPELGRLFPEAKIDYWVRKPFVPLFEQSSGFSVCSERPPDAYDLVIDPLLDYPLQSAKRAASFGAPWSLGFDVAGRGRYFTMPVKPPEGGELFLKSMARLLAPLGFDGEVAAPVLEVSAPERDNAIALTGFDGGYILVHPGAFYPSQRWPAAHMAQAIDMLTQQGRNVVVAGADSDRTTLEEIHRSLQRPEDVFFSCGEPLRMVMALMAEASVVLCNNSGPLHLATALKVPTVSTLGPTNPHVWWPAGEKQAVLVAENCSHCERSDCTRQCLAQIRPAVVVDRIDRLLESG